MDIIFLITGLVAGGLIIFLLMKNRPSAGNGNEAQLQEKIHLLERDHAVISDRLASQARQHEQVLSLLKEERTRIEQELHTEREKLSAASNRLAKAEETFSNQRQKIDEQEKQLEELHKKLTVEFENIANKILEEKSQKFTDQNKTNLDVILNPLKEKIKDFEDKVDKSYKAEAAERNSLKGSIEELMKLNKQISEEAHNLTTALKGDSKKQGNWGELVLERILEGSGLTEGEGYTLQGKGMNLSDENGNRFQPDVIINLPDQKHIVIDSKVSLVAYERLVNAADETEREASIKQHILSLKNHVSGLSAKNYQDLYGINSPDFVLLFVPIESSFSIAVQHDIDLFDFAWSKRVVIVTPSTLLATLKTVASIWKQEQQTKNAIDIATKAGALYDKFVGFITDLKKVGDQIERSREAYNDAYSKLSTGSGNLVGRVETLKKLGAKATKQIDQKLIGEEE